ncbi:MAG TPA: ATP-binding protein [Acidimicrobiia bacterium]|nr:ATP-binding protein [Acidimicrobiia bacterium]
MTEILELLRGVDPFSQLDEAELAALADRVAVVDVPAGRELFSHGDAGDRAYVVLSGELEVRAPGPLGVLVVNVLGRGDLVGETSLIRGTTRNATVAARSDSRLVAIAAEDLKAAIGRAGRALMETLLDRWEETRNQVVRGERMVQLGTLAAGIAHELNNPAAAVRRSSQVLGETLQRLAEAMKTMAHAVLGPEQAEAFTRAMEVIASGDAPSPPSDPLERANLERKVGESIAHLGIAEAWTLAPDAVDAGLDPHVIDRLGTTFGPEVLPAVVELAVATASARRLAEEIGWAAGHMSKVAQDLGSYSRVGEAPIQDVDLTDGLDKSLSLLDHRLEGIEVVREYAPDLPLVTAAPSELNQVWTNLIANAAQAVGPGGRIVLRAYPAGDTVVVEVEDNGPGIAESDQQRVFDAFYTTKPPGSGTGLGLAISRKIVVVDHKGDLSVDSEPGRTVFRAVIPTTPR